MKLKNVKFGETYIIKSLEHTSVGNAPFKIGDKVEVVEFHRYGHSLNTVRVYGGWVISHKDLKRMETDGSPIEYTNPLMEHIGKEVEVERCCDFQTKRGMRGFVVSLSKATDNLLIDFGDGFDGHNGIASAIHPQKAETCWFMMAEELKFLTEDEE